MIRRTIALAISVLTSVLTLYACNSRVIQPSRAELAGVNHYLTESTASFSLDLKAISEQGVVLYYESTVVTSGPVAHWNGIAKVYSNETYFSQSCETLCNAGTSQKKWRNAWAVSDNRSPAVMIERWLGRAELIGRYYTTPVRPAELSPYLSDFEDPAYRISWKETDTDWKALCDAHPDTLFGGESLLGNFDEIQVTLFFNEEDLLLDVILLEGKEDQRWLSMTITPTRVEDPPDTEFPTPAYTDSILSEEWQILTNES